MQAGHTGKAPTRQRPGDPDKLPDLETLKLGFDIASLVELEWLAVLVLPVVVAGMLGLAVARTLAAMLAIARGRA